MYLSFKSFMDSHCVFASATGGVLLRKPMNQPLNGVAEIPQAHARNLLKLNISGDIARRTVKSSD